MRRGAATRAALFWKNDSGARELEQLPQRTPRPPSAHVPAQLAVREGRLSTSACRCAAARRPAGSTIRPPTGRGLRVTCRRARACWMCAATSARWAVTALKQRRRPAPAVSIPPQAALDARSAMPRANGVTRRDRCARMPSMCLKALARAGRALRRRDPRSAGLHQARKDMPAGPGRLPQAQPARDAACSSAMGCWCPARAPITWQPRTWWRPIQAAARHTGRFVQMLEAGGQSPDHPVHPAIPETRYLKAFFCRVTRECRLNVRIAPMLTYPGFNPDRLRARARSRSTGTASCTWSASPAPGGWRGVRAAQARLDLDARTTSTI